MALSQRSQARIWHHGTQRIMQWTQYSWIILPTLTALVFSVFYHYVYGDPRSPLFISHRRSDDSITLDRHALRWLILVLPTRLFWLTGAFFMLWPTWSTWVKHQPYKRDYSRLLICLVTKGDNVELVKQSVRAAQDFCGAIDARISLHVLTEDTKFERFSSLRSDVTIHGVPSDFHPKKAKYKARNLEWFRINMKLQDDDWVLHIDEETCINEYLVRTCVDFMTRQGDKDVGSGIIHYNLPGYFSNPVTAVADIYRLQDDWLRISGLANYRNYAALDVHGGFLLVRGLVENAVTWDTASQTEDYWFLLGACDIGYRFGWIPAIARELSAGSMTDLLYQQRRWFTGMVQMGVWPGLLETIFWAWNLLYPLYLILDRSDPTPKPHWLFSLFCLDSAAKHVMVSLALIVQDADAGLPLWKMVLTQLATIVVAPVSNAIRASAALWALLSPAGDWVVTQKKSGTVTVKGD